MLIDAHVHTHYCNHANLKLKTIFNFYSKKNIVPAITEHNSTAPWKEANKLSKKYNLPYIKGEEIKVYQNNRLVGELLALFMNEEVKAGNIFEVIDRLKSQDALISISHPFDITRKPLFKGFWMLNEIKKSVHAIEIFNSRCIFNFFNEKAKSFANENKLAFTVGTDAHFLCELGNAYLILDANSIEEARKKILKADCKYFGRLSPIRVHIYTQLAKLGFF
ncbi:MAG: PHP-associated domain-containing protein [Candidatus Diapherotrites archaeon]